MGSCLNFFVMGASVLIFLSQDIEAQSIEMNPSTFLGQPSGLVSGRATLSSTELCSTSPNAQRTCVTVPLNNPQHAIGFHSLKRLEAIQGATSQTSGRLQDLSTGISDLNNKVSALATTIETSHNNQLIAIRDQLVAMMETIPLAMIDDETVIAEIRALVIKEVNAAFRRRE